MRDFTYEQLQLDELITEILADEDALAAMRIETAPADVQVKEQTDWLSLADRLCHDPLRAKGEIMRKPEQLIDSLLQQELAIRADCLARAMEEKKRGFVSHLLDYENDLNDIKQAIKLWQTVRPT
jgi:hypothetical protein